MSVRADASDPGRQVAGGPGRSRRRRVLVTLLLGLAIAATGAPAWVHASGHDATGAPVAVAVGGSEAAPQVLAAALAVLAAGAALALVGRTGRWVVAVVLVGCATVVGWGAFHVVTSPGSVAASVLADRTGLVAATGPARGTTWPWVAALLAAACAVLAVWIAASPTGWAGHDRRHERVPTADERSDWDRLTLGQDPTADDGPAGGDGAGTDPPERREDEPDTLG